MQNNLPVDKTNALKSVLDSYLRSNSAIQLSCLRNLDSDNGSAQIMFVELFSPDIYSQIRSMLTQHVEEQKLQSVGHDQVMSALQEKGVIAEILNSLTQPQSSVLQPSSLSFPSAPSLPSSSSSSSFAPSSVVPTSTSSSAAAPTAAIPGRRFLHVQLQGGRAFVESLIDEDVQASGSTLQLCLHFRQQRLRSRPVPFTVEPKFDDSFLIDLQPAGVSVVPFESLVEASEPLHVLVLRQRQGEQTVLASRFVEWRKVLVHGKLALSVELIGGTADLKTPVGLLDLDLEVIPTPPPSTFAHVPLSSEPASGDAAAAASKATGARALPVYIPQAVIVKQINRERVVQTEVEQRFRAYARSWWRDYQQMRPEHQHRAITMFAMAEDGSRRFVSSFVAPMTAGRCLESSLHAARFVRLIPFERELKIGGERSGIWNTCHTFLSLGKGDLENHVLLLCSLLLGFGLDAYVCVGTSGRGASHMWVMTRGHGEQGANVCFWEALTGRRIQVCPPRAGDAEFVAQNYQTIGCVFNHARFFANAQMDDAVSSCAWQLDDEVMWKAMSPDAISMLQPAPAAPLRAPTLNVGEEEERLEAELRTRLAEYRKHTHQLDTVYDATFGYLLAPALSAYEWERLTGFAYGNDEFQQSVKQHIPVHHVFKGFPMQFSSRSSAQVAAALLRNDTCAEVLGTRGDLVRFGLRVKAFAYPENVCAVWVMLAVKFKPAPSS